MNLNDPYRGRQRLKVTAKGGTQLLRQASKQPGGKPLPKSAIPSGNYDVSDLWLRGQGNPFSRAHYGKKK